MLSSLWCCGFEALCEVFKTLFFLGLFVALRPDMKGFMIFLRFYHIESDQPLFCEL
jgi:hypothetical protein